MGENTSTRDKIIDGALELFAEKGFHDTSMAAIAEKCGVGKGTLYWHFSSKEELFKSVFTEKGEVLYRRAEELIRMDLVPEEMLRQYIHLKLRFMAENRELSQLLMSMHSVDDEFKCKLIQNHKRMIQVVMSLIEKGRKDDFFQSGPTQVMALGIIGMLNSMGTLIFMEAGIDLESLENHCYQMIIDGIGKKKWEES